MISITRIKKEVNNKIRKLAITISVMTTLFLALPHPILAASYSEGSYGGSVYSATTQSSSPSNNSGGGSLANTGQDTLLIASGAALCIGVGGTLLLLRRRSKKTSSPTE